MKITKQEVEHLAHLARIELTESEKEKFQKQLSSVLDYVGKLKQIDLKKVEATIGAVKLKNIFRKDQAEQFKKQTDLINEAPDQDNRFYKVKEVFK